MSSTRNLCVFCATRQLSNADAGLRVAQVNGEFKAFASPEEREASILDLVVAGTESGITMVEAGANEVSEDVVADALAWAYEAYQPAIAAQIELAQKVGVVELKYELILPNESIQKAVDDWAEGKLGEDLRLPYPERNELVATLRDQFHAEMEAKMAEDYMALHDEYDEAFSMALHKDVRRGIVEHQLRMYKPTASHTTQQLGLFQSSANNEVHVDNSRPRS